MKTLGVVFSCLLFAAMAFGMSGTAMPTGHANFRSGTLDQTWGPDPYGYRAKDSQEPNGPTFGWRDISATGTEVTGLQDDNIIGPFPIGFNFHYYWYDVHQFWVGSNGYIKFSGPGMLGALFPNFPNALPPNDVIGPYVADWFFSDASPSRCYYQTIGTDTLIVMWQHVQAWQPTTPSGDHNFELFLVSTDSSFTIQHGSLTTSDLNQNTQVVGMENVTGSLGISCLFNQYPTANRAIKFYYPDTVTYVAHDMGVRAVQNPISGGIFMLTGDTLVPWMSVSDVGNRSETGIRAAYSVRSSGNTLLATDTLLFGSLQPAEAHDFQYPWLWVAGAPGLYYASGRVASDSNDVNLTNDSLRVQVHTMTLPGELSYDDNVANAGWGWSGGNGGMANQFVPPVYPCAITELRYYIFATGAGFTAEILSDSFGEPGHVLWSTQITSPAGGAWAVVPVSPPLRIDTGAFYVGWMQQVEGITFGIDSASIAGGVGASRRAWEFAGAWSESRFGQENNCMIRCTIASSQPNRPPQITDHQPATLDTVIQNTTHQFSVTANDPDGDSLHYRWTRNGSQVGTNATANILFPSLGAVEIKCVVSDGELADSVSWNVTVVLPNAVKDNPSSLPTVFALRAAYPNPFNPSTSLAYDIAKGGDVTLTIYDLLGNKVAVLVNGHLNAGRYAVQWNAASQSSGTYFAVLTAGDVRLMQKLLLMK